MLWLIITLKRICVNLLFMSRKIINFAILIIGVGLIISLSRDIFYLLKAGDRVKQAQIQVDELKKKQDELEKKKDYYQSEEFVEEQARDRLNYSKEGESVVILPPDVESIVNPREVSVTPATPNWQQWWSLFF